MEWVYGASFAAVGAYALVKERAELGCVGVDASKRQCADEDSVYVRGTAPAPDDSVPQTCARLRSVLSYHEKAGVWKRCFLIAACLAFLGVAASRAVAKPAWRFAMLHLVFVAVLYFYHNFVNYHHMRVLKKRGMSLARTLGC